MPKKAASIGSCRAGYVRFSTLHAGKLFLLYEGIFKLRKTSGSFRRDLLSGTQRLIAMLSKKCQYAMHALIYLAEHDKGTAVTIGEIAKEKNIPKKFLEAILLDLKNAGILGSKKGKSGGYFLLKEPSEISMIELIRHVDGAVAMLPCVSLNFYDSCGMCPDEKNCRINNLFGQVRDATLKILYSNSIADLSESHKRIETPTVPKEG